MRKFALATAAAAALIFSAPAFTAPAFAQDGSVKVKIKTDGDRSVTRKKVVIRHGGDVDRRRVMIHRDRGHHYGWRHRDAGNKTVIIKKRSGGEGSRTVIKKKTVIN